MRLEAWPELGSRLQDEGGADGGGAKAGTCARWDRAGRGTWERVFTAREAGVGAPTA